MGAGHQAGYPDRLARWLVERGVKVALMNLAESGATAATVRGRQLERVVKKPPDLVLLGVGSNDLWRMVPLESFAADVDVIGARLAETGAGVLVTNVADLSLAPVGRMLEPLLGIPRSLFVERLAALNGALARMALRHGFALVDLHAVSAGELAQHPEYFSADGFHPSAAGYQRWSEVLRPEALRAARAWQKARALDPLAGAGSAVEGEPG